MPMWLFIVLLSIASTFLFLVKATRSDPLNILTLLGIKKFLRKQSACDYLASFAKKDTTLDASIKYKIKVSLGVFIKVLDLAWPWPDAKHLVFIMVHGHAIAVIGFDVDRTNKSIFVRQLQGRRMRGDDLKSLKWERMLLAIVVDWAKHAGYREVCVQRAKNNRWNTVKNSKHGQMIYDVTAKRSGFRLDAGRDVWVRNFRSQAVA